jgi:hypothetical protein
MPDFLLNAPCDFLPPRAILDVLHAAEAAGVKLPKSVDDWWTEQTCKDQAPPGLLCFL